jgi:hypothetical protein
MVDLYAFALSLALVAAAVITHFEALGVLSRWQGRSTSPGHGRILVVISGLIVAHVLEAALFAIGYWFGERILHLGAFVGATPMRLNQFFFFSLEAFTTQGIGDVYPVGPLRLVASLEPLAGLILIGWSTSFTFVMMGLDWRVMARGTGASRH